MGKRKRSGSFSSKFNESDGGNNTSTIVGGGIRPRSLNSDPEDSQEELDGELYNSKGGIGIGILGVGVAGAGVRCSARVQEKQEKLRRESSPSKQIIALASQGLAASSASGGGGGGEGVCSSSSILVPTNVLAFKGGSGGGVKYHQYPSPTNNSNNNNCNNNNNNNEGVGGAGIGGGSVKEPMPSSSLSLSSSLSNLHHHPGGGGGGNGGDQTATAQTGGVGGGMGNINTTGNSIGFTGNNEEKRKKRTWELWSIEDKQMFFEALNEHGKDFDAIQSYLANKAKSKKAGQYGTKNKDQVRHFYYRTWNKISKHLRFPEGMKKANQELYGLVNYGELRKKQRVLNSKSAAKLCELVENGMTSIKFRGKTCRIKTPVCRALKRLNGLEDVDHTRVPHKVTLEFIPRDGKTWRSVQCVSHNPRLKIVASLQRTFASIIAYLEHRWKNKDDRLKEQFNSVFGKPRARLRILPTPVDKGGDFNIPTYRIAENTSSATICLKAYKKNVLHCGDHNPSFGFSKSDHKRKRKQSGGSGGMSCAASCDIIPLPLHSLIGKADSETSDADGELQPAPRLGLNSDIPLSHDEQNPFFLGEMSDDNLGNFTVEDPHHMNGGTDECRGLTHDETDPNHNATETENDEDLDDSHEKDTHEKYVIHSSHTGQVVSKVWDEDCVKRGWTLEEAGVMTVGELYLMFGQTEKICFFYYWDGVESPENLSTHNLLDNIIAAATILRKKKTSRSKTLLGPLPKSGSKCTSCGQHIVPVDPSSVPCTSGSKPCSGTSPVFCTARNSKMNEKTSPQPSSEMMSSIEPVKQEEEGENAEVRLMNPVPVQGESPTEHPFRFENSEPEGVELGSEHNQPQPEPPPLPPPSVTNYNLNSMRPSTPKPVMEGLIDIATLATSPDASIPNIKATFLPPTSSMVISPSGSISVVSQSPASASDGGTPPDMRKVEQLTFHRSTTPLRTLEPAVSSNDSNNEFPPPKPFLDLPKGNRRLGRRPNVKRVVIPRVLPLLPKSHAIVSVVPTDTSTTTTFPLSATLTVVPVTKLPEAGDSSAPAIIRISTSGLQNSSINNNHPGPSASSSDAHATNVNPHPYEMYLHSSGAGTLSCNSTDFEDLLKLKRQENPGSGGGGGVLNAGDMDSLSLSSFMEISLPESAKLAANECMQDLDNSNISLGMNMIRLDKDARTKDLLTPDSSPMKKRIIPGSQSSSELIPEAWDSGDLSLSNLFQFDSHSQRGSTEMPGTEVNFHNMLDDGSLDFSSKLSEIASSLADTPRKE